MRLLIVGICCALAVPAAAATVLYVDDDAPAGGDGASWDTPYRFLQDALAEAANSGGAVEEIRVGQGLYLPDRDEASPGGSGDRAASFLLLDGVALMGGFAGFGAPDPDERDVLLYPATLSGDLAGDDEPDFINNDENSYHVVTASGCDETALLDGFTISAGNADEVGDDGGGGLYNEAGSPTLIDCFFFANAAGAGGGMYNEAASPTLIGCGFFFNAAVHVGAGMFNGFESHPTLSDCSFDVNASDDSGGGMYNYISCRPMLVYCAFSGNTAALYGGGMDNVILSDPTVIDCSFSGNTAGVWGGGMLNDESNATVINSVFAFNEALCGGGVYNNNSSGAAMINCMLIENAATRGGASGSVFSSPTITNCTFSANSASEEGGAMHNDLDSNPRLANCILWENSADTGPEIANAGDSIPKIGFCDIQGSGGSGGGWDEDLGIDRGGNIDADPIFGNPAGYDFHLTAPSPCIDAGVNSAVPADSFDLDEDGDDAERLPVDLDGNPRFTDDPETPDTGCGLPVVVDMGAYEFPGEVAEPVTIGDIDGDGDVDTVDLLALLAGWGPCESDCCLADVDSSGDVDVLDLLALLAHWG